METFELGGFWSYSIMLVSWLGVHFFLITWWAVVLPGRAAKLVRWSLLYNTSDSRLCTSLYGVHSTDKLEMYQIPRMPRHNCAILKMNEWVGEFACNTDIETVVDLHTYQTSGKWAFPDSPNDWRAEVYVCTSTEYASLQRPALDQGIPKFGG